MDSTALFLVAALAGTASSLVSLGFLFKARQRTHEWERTFEVACSHREIQDAAEAVLETLAGHLGAEAAFVFEEREEKPVLLASWESGSDPGLPDEAARAAARVLHGYSHQEAIRLPQIGPRSLALVWVGSRHREATRVAARLALPAVGVFVALRAAEEQAPPGTQGDTRQDFVSLGKLAAGVAHELNTPLATILTNVSRIARTADDPKVSKRVDIVSQAVDRCRTVVEKLQLYARRPYDMEDENLSFSRLVWVPVEVNQLVADTVELNRAAFKDRVETLLADHETTVMADPNALSAAMGDLLRSTAEVAGSLRVSTRALAGEVVVTFESNGTEAGPVVQDLEAARVIVKRHKGRLDVRSAGGQGPLARLHLPTGVSK